MKNLIKVLLIGTGVVTCGAVVSKVIKKEKQGRQDLENNIIDSLHELPDNCIQEMHEVMKKYANHDEESSEDASKKPVFIKIQ